MGIKTRQTLDLALTSIVLRLTQLIACITYTRQRQIQLNYLIDSKWINLSPCYKYKIYLYPKYRKTSRY